MTPKKMKELAVKKWTAIVEYCKSGGRDEWDAYDYATKQYPILKTFEAHCTYCEYFWKGGKDCKNCPIIQNKKTCYSNGSKFDKWQHHPCVRTATAMLKLIKKIEIKKSEDK